MKITDFKYNNPLIIFSECSNYVSGKQKELKQADQQVPTFYT